ncbi:hypothetical protein [Pararhizobium gei]|uniref:hypothetical protein n=1 Tax=Pararhizobium gei TaxID=1395951 RepID=UPI0023DC9C00|nr:hypothetical protein [Rhizobium gei]
MATYKDERGDTVSTADTKRTVEVNQVEARQGFLGRPVLMVLIAGLVLAAVAGVVAGTYGEATDNDAAEGTHQTGTGESKAVITSQDQPVIDNTPPAGETMQTVPADRDPTSETGTGGASQSVSPAGVEKGGNASEP